MKFSYKKIPLSVKILTGMGLGIIFGLLAVQFGLSKFTSDWISPFGEIFVRLLKLIAIPLILVSLIKGVSDLRSTAGLSTMGIKTILFYISTTIIAVCLGISLAYIVRPGNFFPKEQQQTLCEKYSENVESSQVEAEIVKDKGPLSFLVDIVPDNIVLASSQNTMMLQIIFFSILVGITILLLPRKKTKSFRKFIDSSNSIVLKIIEIVMLYAPIGVFALIASVISDIAGDDPSGSLSLFKALGMYVLTVTLGLFILLLLFYPILAKLLGKVKYTKFIKAVLPAQIMGFSTSSSAATLPITKKCVEDNLNVNPKVSSFVLPIGATVNMDGTSLYQAVAAIFIAQVFAVDLNFIEILTIIITATLASIGSAAVPGAGMIMLLIVLSSVNIPVEGLALIFAVDRPLDMLRTSVNITGDSVISVIINKAHSKIKT
ncbi:MAG: dicarboxylate/amino acid:cation symporter [Bacteroidales bacterium]|nr:dicarboxylate/amino acid:cation symporter [Bacteroidales bacterium]